MIPVGLEYLAEMYDSVQVRKAEIRKEIRERYRARAEEEIAKQIDLEDSRVGVALVRAREQGYKRKDLALVIRTNDSAKMRRYLELGGGQVRQKLTGDDRQKMREIESGIVREGNNLFDITLSSGDVVSVYLTWAEGKPAIWSDDRETLTKMHEEFKNGGGLYRKGAEIAALFGIERSEGESKTNLEGENV